MKCTVNQLLEACQEQVAKGNGDKVILLSGDDEGNFFRIMTYLFYEDVWDYTDHCEVGMTEDDFNNTIILG